MSNCDILYKLKHSFWRNIHAGADVNTLKKLATLYTYDTPFEKIIGSKVSKCVNTESVLSLINDVILAAVDIECKEIGGLVNNPSSVTYQLMHIRPFLIDLYYSYLTEDVPIVISSTILISLSPYVGKGISQEYFDNFKNNLYACTSYDEILKFIDSTINGGIKYVTAANN